MTKWSTSKSSVALSSEIIKLNSLYSEDKVEKLHGHLNRCRKSICQNSKPFLTKTLS